MNATTQQTQFRVLGRRPKDKIIRARCSAVLRERLDRIAMMRDIDVSDVIREACAVYATQFEQRLAA